MTKIIEKENLSNIYIAVLHLNEAAKLLTTEHQELSITLYNLVKTLIEQSGLLDEDLKTIENFENIQRIENE